METVNDTLKQFDAIEANLARLEKLWDRMSKSIPDGIQFGGDSTYDENARSFRRILSAMPAIEGHRIRDCIMDLDSIARARFDCREVGEALAEIDTETDIVAQGPELEDYRSRFVQQRRTFTRSLLIAAMKNVDLLLTALESISVSGGSRTVDDPRWPELKLRVDEIGVLLGSAANKVRRWSDLHRHMHFGLWHDFDDIVKMDWPEVKNSIESTLYGATDPLPIAVEDVSHLVSQPTTGPISTKLRWDALSDDDFERLLYTLLSSTAGYENTDWPMKTKATDGGRDISTYRTTNDPLVGRRRHRILIQCKHWLSKSVSVEELAKLSAQVTLWEPPTVDELIVATSGRFSQDAVKWVERHNERRKAPTIVIWPESHLEFLVASRPDIIAQFSLR